MISKKNILINEWLISKAIFVYVLFKMFLIKAIAAIANTLRLNIYFSLIYTKLLKDDTNKRRSNLAYYPLIA